MIKKAKCLYLLLILFPIAFSQTFGNGQKDFCDKKWIVEKYQEMSGDFFLPPIEAENDYLIYRCDGTFESLEMGRIIKGKWIFNSSAQTITVTQSQTKDYPSKVVMKVIKVTNNAMTIQGEDAGGDRLIIFFKILK